MREAPVMRSPCTATKEACVSPEDTAAKISKHITPLWLASRLLPPSKSLCTRSDQPSERVYWWLRGSLVAQMVKNLPPVQETRVWSQGQEDPLEKTMATHSNILAWRIPWAEDPSGLQSMGSQRVRLDWATKHACGYLWRSRSTQKLIKLNRSQSHSPSIFP